MVIPVPFWRPARLDPPRRERLPSRAVRELRGTASGPHAPTIETGANHPHARASRGSSPHDASEDPRRSMRRRAASGRPRRGQSRPGHPVARAHARVRRSAGARAEEDPGRAGGRLRRHLRHRRRQQRRLAARAARSVRPEMPQAGILIARPGIGFPAPVHLERFGSPARLAVTDDPRLASVGGAGMLVARRLGGPARAGAGARAR